MAQYIKKSALVAEIERQRNAYIGEPSKYRVLSRILSFIDTIEVKEVNLEKEIQQHINDCLDIKFPTTNIKMVAKDVEYTARKFFELGLKAQKGE